MVFKGLALLAQGTVSRTNIGERYCLTRPVAAGAENLERLGQILDRFLRLSHQPINVREIIERGSLSRAVADLAARGHGPLQIFKRFLRLAQGRVDHPGVIQCHTLAVPLPNGPPQRERLVEIFEGLLLLRQRQIDGADTVQRVSFAGAVRHHAAQRQTLLEPLQCLLRPSYGKVGERQAVQRNGLGSPIAQLFLDLERWLQHGQRFVGLAYSAVGAARALKRLGFQGPVAQHFGQSQSLEILLQRLAEITLGVKNGAEFRVGQSLAACVVRRLPKLERRLIPLHCLPPALRFPHGSQAVAFIIGLDGGNSFLIVGKRGAPVYDTHLIRASRARLNQTYLQPKGAAGSSNQRDGQRIRIGCRTLHRGQLGLIRP